MHIIIAILFALLALPASTVSLEAAIHELGRGSYTDTLPPDVSGPQSTIYRTENFVGPMPTNDWWSSLAWLPYSERMFPHPLAVWITGDGVGVDYPQKAVAPQSYEEADILTPFVADFYIQADAFIPEAARVHKAGDFHVVARLAAGETYYDLSITHGSPYLFFDFIGANPRITFTSDVEVLSSDSETAALLVRVDGRTYGFYAPSGAQWEGLGSTVVTCRLPASATFFSAAALPDESTPMRTLFADHAFARIDQTRVDWSYDPDSGNVDTVYQVETTPIQGQEHDSLLALYPHQWRNLLDTSLLPATYETARGSMKLFQGQTFTTRMRYHGILPWLPKTSGPDPTVLARLVNDLKAEASKAGDSWDTYWGGKYLYRTANALALAEQVGDTAAATEFTNRIRTLLINWFTTDENEAASRFYYDSNWGTLIGDRPSYGSDSELNDHHFHYGYFIQAAAHLGLRDLNFVTDYGPMVELVLRDFACPDRDDPQFPFLRNFDPYAGHSWASGKAAFADGNNQESSSEAVNAYAGIILWATVTNNPTLRDLGVWLYTQETNAVFNYWFDVYNDVFDPEFPTPYSSMIWGGKYVITTWWTDDPIQVHGINVLPVGGHSLYLGLYADYPTVNYDAMLHEYDLRGTAPELWQDIMLQFLALSDAPRAASLYDPDTIPAEAGESPAHTYQFIQTLQELGQVHPDIIGNTPLSAVFRKNGRTTYVAYNPSDTDTLVTFTDGTTLPVPAHSMTTDDGTENTPQATATLLPILTLILTE